jgi:flagellar hook protein FlgE
MSLQSALYTGVTGLNTYSKAISIIGNNIANVNTPGFKESRGTFSDILSQSSGSSGNLQIGLGVQMNSVDVLFTQGSFQSTNIPSDLAIDGEGLFIVRDPTNNALLYTRTGNFILDRVGNMVNSQGFILQGFDVDSNGNALPFVRDMSIDGQSFPPQVTTSATLSINLDSDAQAITVPFSLSDPVGTSNSSSAISIHDSFGNPHSTEIYFQKQSDNTWEWYLTARETDITGAGTGNNLLQLATGEMTFTTSGALDHIITEQRVNGGAGATVVDITDEQGMNAEFNFSGGAQQNQSIAFNLGVPQNLLTGTAPNTYGANPAATASNQFDGSTQFSAPSATLFQSQNGFASGVLESFSVDARGVVRGLFSNGQTQDILQVALAKFPSNPGLNLIGKNLFSQSLPSGDPVVSSPGSSGLGVIVSNALEISNVDLTSQFVELIRAQQAFQANARVISTGDELLTEVVNLQR